MRTLRIALLCACTGLVPLVNVTAQKSKAKPTEKVEPAAAPTQYFICVTTLHRNMDDKSLTMDGWKAVEKEYLEKVVRKNPYIVGQDFLAHYFTDDNTEILYVTAYDSWNNIEKAAERNKELEKAAWPDEKARNDFLEKRMHYYAHHHSDEIYQSVPGGKIPQTGFTTPVLYYVRVSHWAYPRDGSREDFTRLNQEYTDKVTSKNEFVKAYYPNVHAWGADNTQFTEVFVVDSLADIEKGFDRDEELSKQAWPDDASRKAFFDKLDRYFDGRHSDYIYRLIPELSK